MHEGDAICSGTEYDRFEFSGRCLVLLHEHRIQCCVCLGHRWDDNRVLRDEFDSRCLVGVDGSEVGVVRFEDLGENVLDLESENSSQHGFSEFTLAHSLAPTSVPLGLPLRGQHGV